jgi:hypothetical protein
MIRKDLNAFSKDFSDLLKVGHGSPRWLLLLDFLASRSGVIFPRRLPIPNFLVVTGFMVFVVHLLLYLENGSDTTGAFWHAP